jgi:acyl carrier protein
LASFDDVKSLLGSTLQLGGSRVQSMTQTTPLLGSIPEFDSIAVVNVITALEEHFGFTVQDDEMSAEIFATVGSLTEFVDSKLSAM